MSRPLPSPAGVTLPAPVNATLPSPIVTPPDQSRAASLAEAIVNVVTGYVLAFLAQLVVYPLLGITTTIAENGVIALLFTALSLVRSYGVRRLFVALADSSQRERDARAHSLEQRLATGRLPARRPRGRAA